MNWRFTEFLMSAKRNLRIELRSDQWSCYNRIDFYHFLIFLFSGAKKFWLTDALILPFLLSLSTNKPRLVTLWAIFSKGPAVYASFHLEECGNRLSRFCISIPSAKVFISTHAQHKPSHMCVNIQTPNSCACISVQCARSPARALPSSPCTHVQLWTMKTTREERREMHQSRSEWVGVREYDRKDEDRERNAALN